MSDTSRFLVDTAWLEAHLGDADLRILDCTVFLHPKPGGDMRAESGRAKYDEGHIPGALFADLIEDLSDPASPLRFTLPSAERFAAGMERLGVGEGTRVVLYSGGSMSWAPRLFWMLRAFGFDEARILDGGWPKWTAEGRPISSKPGVVRPARFVARPRPGLFVGKDVVRSGIGSANTCLLNSLAPEQHAGTGGQHYGRPGRIPGSVNVPSRDLLDPQTHAFLPLDALRRLFETAGLLDGRRVVAYCGGGIAASSGAFALAMLGVDDVAVYDASLQEWARDESLPMQVDGPA